MRGPLLVASVALAVVAHVPTLLRAQSAPPDTAAAAPIEDNSFLIEEAYNQERGVVQHINTFQHATTGRGWLYTFTQEWPAPGIRHQLSYTIPVVQADAPGASARVGDVALNYRFQALEGNHRYFAPRLTVLLPTGSAARGSGAGGTGLQADLPLSLELSPRWAAHTNVGGTLVPHGETSDGQAMIARNVTLAQSVIYLPATTFNLMLETVWSRTTGELKRAQAGAASGDLPTSQSLVVSPGARYAFNFASGLQIVPGVAVPLTITGHSGAYDTQPSVFLYLSFEHPFRHVQ